MSWIWTKHIWSRWVTPHWLYGGGCAIHYSSYSSLFYSLILLHVVNTSPTDTVDHPPAHRHFTSKLISGLVQMTKQNVSEVSSLLTHEMRITAARGGKALPTLPIREARVEMLRTCAWDCCLQTLPRCCRTRIWQPLSFGPKCEASFFAINTVTTHSAQHMYTVMITCGGWWQLFQPGVEL